jgi:flagellar biosynthetic protein FliQ
MGTDQVVDLMRHLLREALLISAPILIAASVISFVLSLIQTLTSLQDQTLSTVPRLLAVVTLMLAAFPWFAKRLVSYTILLLTDFHRYLG